MKTRIDAFQLTWEPLDSKPRAKRRRHTIDDATIGLLSTASLSPHGHYRHSCHLRREMLVGVTSADGVLRRERPHEWNDAITGQVIDHANFDISSVVHTGSMRYHHYDF